MLICRVRSVAAVYVVSRMTSRLMAAASAATKFRKVLNARYPVANSAGKSCVKMTRKSGKRAATRRGYLVNTPIAPGLFLGVILARHYEAQRSPALFRRREQRAVESFDLSRCRMIGVS
jgi:hypothetical protein